MKMIVCLLFFLLLVSFVSFLGGVKLTYVEFLLKCTYLWSLCESFLMLVMSHWTKTQSNIWSTLTVSTLNDMQWFSFALLSCYCFHCPVNNWHSSSSDHPIRCLQHNNPPPVGSLPETAQRALCHHSSGRRRIGWEELSKLGTRPMSPRVAMDRNFWQQQVTWSSVKGCWWSSL